MTMDPSSDTTTDSEQAELKTLAARLAVRGSAMHFALAFGATFLGIIAGGISVKLAIDFAKTGIWFFPVFVLALACVAVAVLGFWRGQRLSVQERAEFQRMLELRAKAGLD